MVVQSQCAPSEMRQVSTRVLPVCDKQRKKIKLEMRQCDIDNPTRGHGMS